VPGVLIGIGPDDLFALSSARSASEAARLAVRIRRRARASVLPLMIPLIIMGGILTGWFTPTEAGMIASVYILVVLIPLLNRGHISNLPRDFVYTGLLYSLPLALVAAASAFGWMLAYLRGPDIVAGWIEMIAGHDGRIIMLLLVLLFIVIGDFMDAVPAIIIFMPIVIKLNELGDINSLHMGVVLITTLVFGLITPPYGLSLLVASKFVGVRFSAPCMHRCRSTWCSSSPSRSRCCSRTSCSICRSSSFPSRSAASRIPSGVGYICPK
jgi:TRAP-type C4-dicarboxylate transport system permease large subunit